MERPGDRDPASSREPSTTRHERLLAVALRAATFLPLAVAERVLGAIALGQGLATPALRRRAFAWAERHAADRRGRRRLAWRLLANRGRFTALRAAHALSDPEPLKRRVRMVGADALPAAPRGAGLILLVFHIGVPGSTLGLRLAGRPLVSAGDDDHLAWPPPRDSWRELIAAHHAYLPLRTGDGAGGLYRVRRALLAGQTVILAADAHSGTAAFSVPLPGGELIVRRAWWMLRRQTAVPVVPVLSHLEGRRLVGTFHAPLPAPDPDPARDLEACRATLGPMIAEFVARHPDQCLSVAFDDPATDPPAASGTRGVAGHRVA